MPLQVFHGIGPNTPKSAFERSAPGALAMAFVQLRPAIQMICRLMEPMQKMLSRRVLARQPASGCERILLLCEGSDRASRALELR
jgi:hypothetical protein